ncbi:MULTISPECIES: hypothetical protein [unclassified Bradyrhizobium]|uniref:hypothetical protein n=1 Tax=unclassified Bradyrhizobium TaxID=2631580 RepID=UPI0028EE3101|nr:MULTISPECIES: hypothetical protein [unclassified Bradyrhizobium]
MRVLTNVEVKIVPRMAANGHPFTELLHTWTEDGLPRNALSRVNYSTADTPGNRAYHIQMFKQRQARYEAQIGLSE